MTMSLQESIMRSRNGNPLIDTPHAACDLYYILLKRYELNPQDNVIDIVLVDHGLIQFRVKCVMFRFCYQPGSSLALFYKHIEGDKWYDAGSLDGQDPVIHIVNLVSKYAYDEVPRPI